MMPFAEAVNLNPARLQLAAIALQAMLPALFALSTLSNCTPD